MKISTCKSETMVLKGGGEEFLPQVEDFKYLRMEQEIDGWINPSISMAVTAVQLSRSIVVKRESTF